MSFLQKIKNHFATRTINKILKQNRNSHYIEFDSIKSVLLLFEADSEEQNLLIKNCIATLNVHGKKVSAWGYLAQKEIASPIFPHYRLFANKDLSFSGIPASSIVKELQMTEYDLVMQLTTKHINALDYLLAAAISPLKISGIKPYKRISDLMIDTGENTDIEFLFQQMLFYLQKIKTK